MLNELLVLLSPLLHGIGQCVGLDLLHHGQQAVGARGRKMLFQSYAVDEIEVGIEYFLRCVPADDADEQGDRQ